MGLNIGKWIATKVKDSATEMLQEFLDNFDADENGQKDIDQVQTYVHGAIDGAANALAAVVIDIEAQTITIDAKQIRAGAQQAIENSKQLFSLVKAIVSKYAPREDADPKLKAACRQD